MLIINRRQALKYTFTMIGSVIIISDATREAEANIFDDIGGAISGGFNHLVDAGKTVVNTAVQGLGYATQAVPDLAKTALGIANKAAETVLPQVAPVIGQAAQQFLPLLVNQMQQQMAGGPLQSLPLLFNATQQPFAMPMQTDRADQPMQIGSSDEMHLRDSPYSYMQQNAQMLNDYTQRYSVGEQFHNFPLRPRNFGAFPIRPQAVSGSGFFPSIMRFSQMAEELAPLASMFLA